MLDVNETLFGTLSRKRMLNVDEKLTDARAARRCWIGECVYDRNVSNYECHRSGDTLELKILHGLEPRVISPVAWHNNGWGMAYLPRSSCFHRKIWWEGGRAGEPISHGMAPLSATMAGSHASRQNDTKRAP